MISIHNLGNTIIFKFYVSYLSGVPARLYSAVDCECIADYCYTRKRQSTHYSIHMQGSAKTPDKSIDKYARRRR